MKKKRENEDGEIMWEEITQKDQRSKRLMTLSRGVYNEERGKKDENRRYKYRFTTFVSNEVGKGR